MPRAKTAKRYRKLMEKFQLSFGFREPYQILIDAPLLADACRFKMDLLKGFKQTLSGEVKPLITQCSMRHLYNSKGEPGVEAAIELGKTFERRRCGHHPQDYPEPLSTLECFNSVVDPKSNSVNKHRYVVAANDQETRQMLRGVMGTPLVYISRSVMIMEPMADETAQARGKDERAKLRAEIKRFAEGKKRKRDDNSDGEGNEDEKPVAGAPKPKGANEGEEPEKKKKKKGVKGPNPLAVKRKTKPTETPRREKAAESKEPILTDGPKRKRRKKAKAQDREAEHGNASESAGIDAGDSD